MIALLSLSAMMTCTLAPVSDMTIPEGTVPVVDIKLPADKAEAIVASIAPNYDFAIPEERFVGEESKRELLLIGRSPFGSDRFQVTRISKTGEVHSPSLAERSRLYWLKFQFGDATWSEEGQSFDFTHQFDGTCKLENDPGLTGGTNP